MCKRTILPYYPQYFQCRYWESFCQSIVELATQLYQIPKKKFSNVENPVIKISLIQ